MLFGDKGILKKFASLSLSTNGSFSYTELKKLSGGEIRMIFETLEKMNRG